MGTPFAPAASCFYMEDLEAELDITPVTTKGNYLILHKRYIDDIFIIFQGKKRYLKLFLEEYNSKRPKIKVNWKISQNICEFLDLVISVDRDKHGIVNLQYHTHQKSMNTYLYIPKNSFHSPAAMKGFILGELGRYARTCSQEKDFLKMAIKFAHRLRARGHSGEFISKIFTSFGVLNKGYSKIRDSFFAEHVPVNKPFSVYDSPKTPFILPYNPSFARMRIKNALTSGSGYFEVTKNLQYNHIVGKPIISWKREKNLGNYLINSKFPSILPEFFREFKNIKGPPFAFPNGDSPSSDIQENVDILNMLADNIHLFE